MLKPSLITNKTKKDQLCIVHCECIYCGFKQCLLEEFGPFSRVFHAFLALFMPCLQIVFLSFFCHTSFLTTQDFPLFFSHRFFLSACIYCYWCSPQDHFFLSSGTQNRSDVARRHRCACSSSISLRRAINLSSTSFVYTVAGLWVVNGFLWHASF